MLFGKISASNILNQREITFKQANKGYFESGMQINNLYVLNSAGYGIGGYYHWGNYVSSDWKKNIALKLSLSLSF